MARTNTKTRKTPQKPAPPEFAPVRRIGEDARAEAMRMLVAGMPIGEVADALGVDRGTITAWKHSPEGYSVLAEARKAREAVYRDAVADGVRKIREATDKAIDVLVDQLDHSDPEVRSLAARTLLDRGGIPRTQRLETSAAPAVDYGKLSPDELRAVRELQRKAQAN